MDKNERDVPVFIHPSELLFYIENEASHNQILSIYNPYTFPIKYQVFSNATGRYNVSNSSNKVAPHSYVEMRIKHKEPSLENCYEKDNILITICDAGTNEVIGKKCICATLLPACHEADGDEETENLYQACKSSQRNRYIYFSQISLVVFSLFLIVLLMLPTKCDEVEVYFLLNFLQLSSSFKVVMSYLLGFITLAVILGF